jgi:hypothetical protein
MPTIWQRAQYLPSEEFMRTYRFYVDLREAAVCLVEAEDLETAKRQFRSGQHCSKHTERLPQILQFVEDEQGNILEKAPPPVDSLPKDVIETFEACATFLERLRTEPPAPDMRPEALALQAKVLALLANPVAAAEPSREELIDIAFAYADALDLSDEDRTEKTGSGADVVDQLWMWVARVRRAVGMLTRAPIAKSRS